MNKSQNLKKSILTDGVIDETEAKWLLSHIQGNGQLDKVEKALLVNLRSRVEKFPATLDFVK
jgi:hypothetical protein